MIIIEKKKTRETKFGMVVSSCRLALTIWEFVFILSVSFWTILHLNYQFHPRSQEFKGICALIKTIVMYFYHLRNSFWKKKQSAIYHLSKANTIFSLRQLKIFWQSHEKRTVLSFPWKCWKTSSQEKCRARWTVISNTRDSTPQRVFSLANWVFSTNELWTVNKRVLKKVSYKASSCSQT